MVVVLRRRVLHHHHSDFRRSFAEKERERERERDVRRVLARPVVKCAELSLSPFFFPILKILFLYLSLFDFFLFLD